MIGRLAGLAAATFAAGPATALSCARPDVARSFEAARAADEVYAVVLGRFAFEGVPGGPASVPATFEGRLLGADGFTTPVSRPMTLSVTCAAAWCGQIESGVETLAFVEQGEDGLTVAVTPCPQWVFQDPSAEQVATAETCMAGTCE